MALPLLPILLLLGGGAAVAALVAAKNAKGQDVKLGERHVAMYLHPKNEPPSLVLQVERLSPTKWEWMVPNWIDEMGEPYAGGAKGEAATRRQAFNAAYASVGQMSDASLGLPIGSNAAGLTMQLDFLDKFPELAGSTTWENPGESLIFRATIIPTSGGWLTQITDPSATVKFLQTYSSKSKALHEVFNFIEKAGY